MTLAAARPARRGLRPLVLCVVVLLAAALTVAGSATAAPVPTGVTTTRNCAQDVSPGHYACFAERRTDLGSTTRKQLAAQAGTPSGYGPAQLQDAYDLATAAAGNGTGERVYVVDAYNDPTAEADLAVYRSQYGLAPCTTGNGCFQQLNQTGTTSPLPANNPDWSGEIALDLQMVSAVCPNCSITLVEASAANDALFVAVKEAVKLGAKFVSMSWGGPEDGTEAKYDQKYLQSSGVVFTAATGDDSYSAGPSYPATSPDVVAVGGTSLQASSTTRGWTETAWYNSHGGAGSGCSSSESKPSWQSVVPNSVCGNRAIADVSAVADPSTGVAVYNTTGDGGWEVYGGTSAAAPIIAATYALAGTPAATATPAAAPYLNSTGLNDVTSGSTGTCSPTVLCTAGTGWDGPTGLGTPNGVAAFTTTGTTSPPPPTPPQSGPPTACAPFTDVTAANQFCADIAWAKAQGVATGNTDGSFTPAASVLRQAMAGFLYRYEHPGVTPAACTTEPFSDVATSNVFCADIAALKAEGVIAGNGDGTYSPGVSVSRQTMAAFLYRIANPGGTAAACTTKPFPDVAVGDVFCGDITWLAGQHVTGGYPDGGFHPTTVVARQEMAAFLHRLDTAGQ